LYASLASELISDTINNMENYATTSTDDNRWEELPSPSTMEHDQSGGSSLEHRYVSANGASTSYVSAQDQDLAETSTSSSRNVSIRRVSTSAFEEAQARDQARDSSLNADAPVWEMARTSPPKPMKSGIYLLECSRGVADVLTLLGPASLIASGP
jgi:hypothetical protein